MLSLVVREVSWRGAQRGASLQEAAATCSVPGGRGWLKGWWVRLG
jgi:hypothetical protein